MGVGPCDWNIRMSIRLTFAWFLDCHGCNLASTGQSWIPDDGCLFSCSIKDGSTLLVPSVQIARACAAISHMRWKHASHAFDTNSHDCNANMSNTCPINWICYDGHTRLVDVQFPFKGWFYGGPTGMISWKCALNGVRKRHGQCLGASFWFVH